jgi:hypothetical protein
MKTKVLAIAATAILGGGIAMHVGHEPKCLMKLGIVKKQKEVKTEPVVPNQTTPETTQTSEQK